jgi:D-alanyl-D-alanine carboxypeptidase
MRRLVRRNGAWWVPAVLAGALAVATTAAASVTPAVVPASSPASSTSAAPTDARLRAALDALVAAGASGAALRVDDGDRTVRLASGAARLEPRVPLRPDARLRVGSTTKTFVSTVALQLVGERRLRLEDSVERWLPGLVPGGDKITIRQLLNHTSGIFNYTGDPALREQFLTDPLRRYAPTEIIALATAHPPVFPPGEGWSYSNTNYFVLGLILERVTRRTVAQLVHGRIIAPLRLRDTVWPVISPNIPGYHARGYIPPSISGAGYVDFTRISPTAPWAAGALISNPDDLRRFYQALLSGRLLRPAQLEQMKATVTVGPGRGYGLGLFTIATPCGTIWGHDGSVPGYVTFARSDEGGRRGFVLALPTEPDERIVPAMETAVDLATCRAFGRPGPAGSAAGAGNTARAERPTPPRSGWLSGDPSR